MINAQKLRELIAGANAATEAHGETDWYAPPGTIYIDPNGIGKADFEFIAFLSPERATALLDHIDAQTAEIARLCEALRKIESVGGDATSGDGHARCKQIARAALSGESK